MALKSLDSAARLLPVRRQAQHLVTGRRGEEEAYFYLRSLGYVMVARNFRSARRRGEIDLIGWEGDILCFIEVKTRSSHSVAPAEAAGSCQAEGVGCRSSGIFAACAWQTSYSV